MENKTWPLSEFADSPREWQKEQQRMTDEKNMLFFMGGFPIQSEEGKIMSRLKYAHISEGDKKYISFVDNETKEAYIMVNDSYMQGLVQPLEKIKDFTFIKWVESFMEL